MYEVSFYIEWHEHSRLSWVLYLSHDRGMKYNLIALAIDLLGRRSVVSANWVGTSAKVTCFACREYDDFTSL